MNEGNAASIELAQRQLEDISELRETTGFTRYWIYRLRQKRGAIEERFRHDPPSKVDAQEREILRRILDEYDELIEMMDSDERGAKAFISGQRGSSPGAGSR
jgi:hypothetical protein